MPAPPAAARTEVRRKSRRVSGLMGLLLLKVSVILTIGSFLIGMGAMVKSNLVVGKLPATNGPRLCNFKGIDKVMSLGETGLVKRPSLETWRARGTRCRRL